MSEVLTNGVIIPENGSRNWGGDLANNWNILDVHVGYMNDVKNSVTTLENSVAENTANIQINTSNISALQTSKQDAIEDLETIRAGASAGATAVQPSVLSDYLPLSGGYITGNIINSSTSDDWKPGFEWLYNNERFAYIHAFTDEARSEKSLFIQADTHINLASQNLIFLSSRTVSGNTYQNALNFQCATNGTFNFYSNTPTNLGTSSNKWKTLNGINPGALSLPNHNSYLDIKGNLPASVSDNAWASRYHITPEQDGILILVLNDCSGVVVWNGLDLPSYGDRDTSINLEKRVMAFVLKGVTYGIYTTNYSQIATARLFYCQGNV